MKIISDHSQIVKNPKEKLHPIMSSILNQWDFYFLPVLCISNIIPFSSNENLYVQRIFTENIELSSIIDVRFSILHVNPFLNRFTRYLVLYSNCHSDVAVTDNGEVVQEVEHLVLHVPQWLHHATTQRTTCCGQIHQGVQKRPRKTAHQETISIAS